MYEIEDHQFYKVELDAIISQLEAIKLYSKYVSEINQVRNEIVERSRFDDQAYHALVRSIMDDLKASAYDESKLKLVLDLSRIDASVFEIYEEYELVDQLISFLGKHDYSPSDRHDTVVINYIYSFYVNNSIRMLQEHDFSAFIDFLKHDTRLQNSPHKTWMLQSIFSSLLHQKYFNEAQLKVIVSEFEGEESAKIKWYLQKL
ncbi:MAG: hypothetical protein ACPGJS_21245 [Flammeovirgaceae bacterium]